MSPVHASIIWDYYVIYSAELSLRDSFGTSAEECNARDDDSSMDTGYQIITPLLI